VASVRSCEKLLPCLLKPVPAGSKTDPPLAKAEPISDGGSASGITELRKGRKKSTAVRGQLKRADDVRETTLQTPRSVKKEVPQMLEQRVFPCSS